MHDAIYWIAASRIICAWLRGHFWGAVFAFAAILVLFGTPLLPPVTGWRTTPAEDVVSDIFFAALFALAPMTVLRVRDWFIRFVMELDARRDLPALGITLPGLEKMTARQGRNRWAGGRGDTRQLARETPGKLRVEPTLEKPIG
jgi:hypothetical protein